MELETCLMFKLLGGVMVIFTLEEAMNAQRGSTCIAILFL
jgi:hypothetical protein